MPSATCRSRSFAGSKPGQGTVAFRIALDPRPGAYTLRCRPKQRIEGVRRHEEALPADASALARASELCRRQPAGSHYPAVLTMQIIETNERCRAGQVKLMLLDANRAARDGSAS